MNILRFTKLLAVALCAVAASVSADAADADLKTSEEYRIGVMVKAIAAAIQVPEKPESLETVAHYGTDTRYCVMIRGWLVQELSGVESQLAATRDDPERKAKFQRKVDFLKKALRRIDLE